MADDLTTCLKQAKSKKMFFAFVVKGNDGTLIVSKKKIPPKEVAEAKKELGGGMPVLGKCSGPLNEMVFEVLKPAPATLPACLKKVVKRDAGLTVIAEFRVATDAEDESQESEEEVADVKMAAAAPAPPKAATDGASNDDAAADLNLAAWSPARDKALNDLRTLAKQIATSGYAGWQEVVKELNSIIVKLPATPTLKDLDKLETYISTDDTVAAAHEIPSDFFQLDIKEPLLAALQAAKADVPVA